MKGTREVQNLKSVFRLLSLSVCAGLLCQSGYAQSPLSTDDVIRRATQEDAKVQAGSLLLVETIIHHRQSAKDLKKMVGTGQFLKGALQIEKETPTKIVGTRKIFFNNNLEAVLIENSDDHQTIHQKVYLDRKVTKNYLEAKNVTDSSKRYTPTYAETGPLPHLIDYNLVWVSRFWQNMDTKKALLRHKNNGLLVVELPERFGHKRFVEVNPAQKYAIKTLTKVDLKQHRTRSEIRVTRTLRDGIWYPSKIIQFTYDVNAPVDKKVIDETITIVQSADLNTPVTEKDLAFGDIPEGTRVTNSTFNPPLNYDQGKKQFTYAELQKLSKEPDALSRATAKTSLGYVEAQQKRAKTSTFRSVLTALVGLVAGVFLILAGRRILRRPL